MSYEIAPTVEMRLYVRNVHMFDEKLLSNVIKKIDSDDFNFTSEEKMALYGLLRNQYIRTTGHDLL